MIPDEKQGAHKPHGGRFLAWGALWNLGGNVLPLTAALIALPPLTRQLGPDRLGVLSIGWMLIGYFSLFDLGLGRALTKLIAERIGTAEEHQIAPLCRTAMLGMGACGLIGGAVFGAAVPWFVSSGLNVPKELLTETRLSLFILAAALPLTVVASGARGILEGTQRFDLVNAVRIPTGILSFVAPLSTSFFTPNLAAAVAALAGSRVIVLGVYAVLANRTLTQLNMRVAPSTTHDPASPRSSFRRMLFGLGGWMTVTNVVGPLMTQMDRTFLGTVISAAAVAYYTIPFEIVTKLCLIPGSLVAVLFPLFASSLSTNRERTARLVSQAAALVALTVFPFSFALVGLAYEILQVWIADDFAVRGVRAMQWLSAGVFINCLAYVPSTLLQSGGRPDWTAKTHLIELPLYLIALWYLVTHYGIEGAAIAWTARVTIDAIAIFLLAKVLLPEAASLPRYACITIAASLLSFLLLARIDSLLIRVLAIAACFTATAAVGLYGFKRSALIRDSNLESAVSQTPSAQCR